MTRPRSRNRTAGGSSRFSFLAPLLLLGLALVLSGSPAQAQDNPVRNPSFEGDYFAWSGIPEIQVAHDWTPWWAAQQASDPPEINRRPEYKQANPAVDPHRVHSGSAAQQYFTFYSTHIAGMYQQVSGVQPGTRLQFSIWGQAWSSNGDDPRNSTEPGTINMQVGIDPTGKWDPWAGSVVWSGQYNTYDVWFQLAVEAIAQSDTVTVFMKSAPVYPVKHNDVYWDDATLIVVGNAPPPHTATPEPAPTDPAATSTSEPTATLEATSVPPTDLPPTVTPTCAPAPADWVPYVVQSGEYLTKLSVRHDVSVDEIVAANCLGRNNLYAGETLLLPPLPPTPTAAPPTATPVAPQPTATESVPTDLPVASATPIQIAAATLTASPVPPPSATPAATGTSIATETAVPSEPVAPVEPAASSPVFDSSLIGICGAALGATILLVGLSFVVLRRRGNDPDSEDQV